MALILSTEGNIGAGKSTLIRGLKDKLSDKIKTKIILLQEPVDIWDTFRDKEGVTILEKFYNNQKQYAFAFQMMAYISRLQILKDTVKRYPSSIILCERSIWTDRNVFAQMLFDEGKIEEIEFLIYNKWFDCLSSDFSLDGIIYLKTSPEICQNRITVRDRKGETIPLQYLERCNDYHTKWLKNKDNVKVLDGNHNSTNSNISDEWITSIADFINDTYEKKYPSVVEFDFDALHEKIYC